MYDITPPTLTAGPVTSPTTKPTQVVKGMREADTQVNVTCATATVGAVTYPTANTWEVSITNIHPGENSITVTSSDAAGNVSTASVKIVYLEKAPDVSITATPRVLWPPDHKLVPVMLGGEVVPHGTGLQSLSISVADEYGKYVYTNLKYGTTIMLEAWRNGADIDGRVYTITAVATDNAGNTATQTTTVIVPHDQSR